jgi:Polyketide cyclase / dehydrase and lipid transport
MHFAMASIHKEMFIDSPADTVWSVFRDLGAVHTRLAPGFVTDCRLDPDGKERLVAFANGFVVREVLVHVDDAARRLAYSARNEKLEHHNAYFQVIPMGEHRCRVVWVADLLPEEAAESMRVMMDQGAQAMKRALESNRRPIDGPHVRP